MVCLDGATWRILDPFMKGGDLTHFSRLKNTGVSGVLMSVYPPLSAPAWVSFLSAMNPAKHGVFDFDLGVTSNYQSRKQREKGKKKLVDSTVYNGLPNLFDILSDNERSVFSLALPITYPPRPLNGYLFTGFLTPPSSEIFTFPFEMSREIQKDFPAYTPDIPFKTRPSRLKKQAALFATEEREEASRMLQDVLETEVDDLTESEMYFLKEIIDVSRRKISLLEWSASSGRFPADVNIIYFRDLDLTQHFFWGRMDILRGIYKHMDRLLGEILAYFDEGADYVFVISDHGFGPVETDVVYLNTFLAKSGYLRVQRKSMRDTSMRRLRSRLSSSVLKKYLTRMKFIKRRKAYLQAVKYPAIDYDRSSAWADGVGGLEGIYINENITASQREELKNRIYKDLTEKLEDSFQGIHFKEDLYSGPYMDRIPDIVTMPRSGTRCSLEFDVRMKGSATDSPEQSGHHRAEMDGIFLCRAPFEMEASEAKTYSLMDIVPTVLHLMDCKIDSRMDGIVIREVLPKSEGTEKNPEFIEYRPHVVDSLIQKEANQKVVAQLKNLGYIDE
jgi:predicted AlkP superfamily phosphohydrolase/phosphomutase